jgi:uncharacterized protein (DUF58 family)
MEMRRREKSSTKFSLKSRFQRKREATTKDALAWQMRKSLVEAAGGRAATASPTKGRPHRPRRTFRQSLWWYIRFGSWTRRFVDAVWRFKLTNAGKWIVAALWVSSTGVVGLQLAIYQVFCALAALIGVAWTFGHLLRPKLDVTGSFPEKLVAGERARAALAVANHARRDALAIGLIARDLGEALCPLEIDGHLLTVPAGGSVSFPVSIQPMRRGLYRCPDVVAFTAFPFDMVRIAAGRLVGSPVLVLPSFHRLGSFELATSERHQPGGVLLSSHVGECPEYIGNREYVPGEPIRRLDFRAWARLGTPVVKEYQEEYFSRVALVLDTHLSAPLNLGRWKSAPWNDRTRSGEAFEAAVSLTAAIADALSIGEHVIDLFAAGPELYVFRSGRHTAHFENLLELLACVDVCPNDPFDAIAPAVAEELAGISSAVCVLLDWDDSRRRFVRTIVESGCPTKVILVRSGAAGDPVDPSENVQFVELAPEEITQGAMQWL